MESCENCGMPLRKGETVCRHCRKNQGQQNEGINKRKSVSLPSFPYKKIVQNIKLRPLTKKGKIILFTSLITVAILVGVHLTISSLISPMSVVEEFEKAVLEKDAKHLATIINKGQKTYKISEKEAASYISFLTKENNFTTIDNQLKMQANGMDNSQEFVPMPITDKNGNHLVSLVKDYKNKWLFYDQFYLEFYPFSLSVSSNLPNTEIFVNDKKATDLKAAETPVSIGFVFPGEYRFKGTFKSEYGDITKEENINLTEGNENSFSIYLQLDNHYISISSNHDDAILFVNGQSTGEKVNQLGSFGPVKMDGSIKLHAERKINGKDVKTEIIPVTNQTDIDFMFEEEELVSAPVDPIFEKMSQFMNNFYRAQVQAINSGNPSKASNFHDSKGKSLKEMKDYVKSMKKKGITEELIGMTLVNVKETKGGYNVTTEEEYDIFYPSSGTQLKKYQTKYYIRMIKGEFKVNALLETKEI